MRIMKKAKFDKELVQVLCPYGEWKHSRGMQVVDFESARRMKRSMLILRALGGIPIYIGHPDDYPDGEKVPVGKIVGIFRRTTASPLSPAIRIRYAAEF